MSKLIDFILHCAVLATLLLAHRRQEIMTDTFFICMTIIISALIIKGNLKNNDEQV